MNYEELVKKLLDLHRDPRPASSVWLFDNQIALYDAADAIEALQAEIRESMQKCAECGDRMVEPKRGEWKETDMGWDGDTAWVCSVCGEPWTLIDGTPKENNMNFCPNCGSRMRGEVNERG